MTSEELIGIRKALGKTQTEIASYLGVSLRTVQRWEWGELNKSGEPIRIPGPAEKLLRIMLATEKGGGK